MESVIKQKYNQSEKIRIILDTDANNELDDQHAIAYMLFNDSIFDVEGITINKTKSGGSIDDHYDEANRVVKLCGWHSKVELHKGATGLFDEIKDQLNNPVYDGSDAVDFIISMAQKESNRKLVLLSIGKLTNIALAIHKLPSIAPKIKVVWLGSNYPKPGEYNQENDLLSVQYIIDCNVDFQIALVRYGEPSGTDAVRVSLSEIEKIMPGKGPHISTPVMGRHGGTFTNFGDYSVNLFQNISYDTDPPSRALFDMAAVAIVKNPNWAKQKIIPKPELIDGIWHERPDHPDHITLWENFEKEKIIDDYFSSIKNYVLDQSK